MKGFPFYPSRDARMMLFETLSVEEVLHIHERLVEDAVESEDPISPPGVKDHGLLESAISRQQSGFAGKLKYDDPILNAVSLCYGICCNHALHNGNKRTALVALLCHLDKNNWVFSDRTNQDELYKFMLNVASHKIAPKSKFRRNHDQSDLEVELMTAWVRKRIRKVEKGERTVTYAELEKILRNHNILFDNHRNNYVDLVQYRTERRKTGWFTTKEVTVGTKIANIPFWPGRTVGRNLIKSIRTQAGLTHKDGIDSALFYGSQATPDDFIQKYKRTLRLLAKT